MARPLTVDSNEIDKTKKLRLKFKITLTVIHLKLKPN